MALSEQEQQLLDQLEKQLNEDPAFASTMTDRHPAVTPTGKTSPRNMVIGALVAVLGLGVIIAGVATKLILLGVLGFIIAAGGVYFATTTPRGTWGAPANPQRGTPTKKPGSSRFMQNLEDKWDKRQNGNRF